MGRHFAFMCVPAHGHVNPGLPIAAELVRRGHRVTYATNDEFAGVVARTGAEVVRYRSTVPSEADPAQRWPEEELSAHRMFLDELISVTPQVEAAYAGDVPDAVVHDVCAWHGPVLAHAWGVPAVQVSPTFVPYDGIAEDFGVDPAAPKDPVMARMVEEMAAFLVGRGVPLTPDEVKFASRRGLVMMPREWQVRGERVGPQYTFVGSGVRPVDDADAWRPPDDRKVLLVSLGSAYNDKLDFYRRCVSAFAPLDWHVLLSVGRFTDPAALGRVPAHIEVVRWAPQQQVLAHASAFVTHAGMGSTMEALYHGVPMVAVPQAWDQYLNGYRIAKTGVGAHLPTSQATPARLREAVLRVSSDPTVRASVARMQQAVRSAGGAAAAADALEAEVAAAQERVPSK
nr:macrolide family glycosyltransferase [Actinokineospora bangkokensis]